MKPRPKGARGLSKDLRNQLGSTRPSVRHGYFRSFDGTKIFYSIEGTGRPLIFCYGLVCSSLHWTYQIDYFRRNYQTIWLDYRGHQNSEVPKDLKSLTIKNIACDVGLLLDEIGIENAVFLGHSMGVNIVLELYRQRPQQVAAMVLANGTPKPPLETMFHRNITQAGFPYLKKAYDLSPGLVSWLWKKQSKMALTKSLVGLAGFNLHLSSKEDVDLYIDQVAEMDPGILFHLMENYENYDATSWLHQVRVPTLVVAGENDHIIPREQQELMHQLIPDSQMEVIRHGSHCPQMDLPELVNLKIERFLNEIGYQAPIQTTETASPPTEQRPGLLGSEADAAAPDIIARGTFLRPRG